MRAIGVVLLFTALVFQIAAVALALIILLTPPSLAAGFEQQCRLVRAAVRSVNYSELFRLIGSLRQSDMTRLDKQTVFAFTDLTDMIEDVTPEARAIMDLVFQKYSTVNADASYRMHPLTAAYQKKRYNVAARLLQHMPLDKPSAAVREVYAHMLVCDDLPYIDSSVRLVISDGERRPCMTHFPRRVGYATSRLRAVYESTNRKPQGNPPAPPPRISRVVIAPPSTIRAGMWLRPFVKPPPGILPPASSLVMNPAAFDDAYQALWYYINGFPLNSTKFVILVAVQTGAVIFCHLLRLLLRLRAYSSSTDEAAVR